MAAVPESRPIKFTITHHRQQQHSHEAFMKWMVEEHLPLAMPVFVKYGVLEYSLFATPPSINDALKQEIIQIRPSWDFADFDCFIEYTLPDVETIKKVMSDPEWQIAVKDQSDWVQVSKALVSVGYSTPYVLNGKPVNMAK
ncbi:Dimeric alpha-beta barrel [Penicillium concentricum]|uniref:Dimeric alpha-beta barrel n=1 Tax=Penicillium concentricum TaxID=293559 RepID=A0A9W9R8J6_9EURO|nr:Dimeric alpha-beta barrel [Penicillium concentricum]KAJ5355697.1 Dimeric alpha-beta barrel [Penicillium concentricum]